MRLPAGVSSPLPNRVVAGVRFIGRGGGAVKNLDGFKKGRHRPPDNVNATTTAFLGRLCAGELQEEAEAMFQRVRAELGYKRRDATLSVAGPQAVLTARDFTLFIRYELDGAAPARYAVTRTLQDLAEADMAGSAAFGAVFAGMFTELAFELRQGTRVEAVVDAIEALEDGAELRVDYPSDCRECTISVPGVAARVRCTGGSLDMLFTRAGAPGELLAEFAAVREAFQLSKALAGVLD